MGDMCGPQFRPPCRLPEEVPLIKEQLRAALPDLFTGGHKSMLYVGASRRRRHVLDGPAGPAAGLPESKSAGAIPAPFHATLS